MMGLTEETEQSQVLLGLLTQSPDAGRGRSGQVGVETRGCLIFDYL